MATVSWKRISAGVLVAGAAAGVAAALFYGNRYLDQFEDTGPLDLARGSFVRTNAGWHIHYTVQGKGTPVVLIHGFLDSLQTWQRNTEILARNHRVYALDVLGFGSSERVRDPIYTLKQQAAFLKEFFESQNIERADIVGHSMGGALALQFAYDFPASVHKLVLVAPATFLYNRFPRNGLWTIPRPVTRGVLGIYERLQGDKNNPLHFAYGNPERITREQIVVRNRMMRVRGQHDALISMSKSRREADVPQGLDQVTVATLIIWGTKDRVVPVSHAVRHEHHLPNARLVWIENAGHLPHEEEPELVNQLITSFLNDSST